REESSSLEGILERIAYTNEANGWSVVHLRIPERAGEVTAVGDFLGVRPGESLRLRGRWEVHPRYGEQFHVESYIPIEPATLAGLEKFLASGLIAGMGPVMAKRLVQRFGLQTLKIIETQGDRLLEVEGIGPVRKDRILSAWHEHHGVQEILIFLQSHSISIRHAIRIYRRYGARAIAVLRENPYQLATDIRGIGFQTADAIAQEFGIAPDSPYRVQAGLLFHLAQAVEEGNVFAERTALLAGAAELLEVTPKVVEMALEVLQQQGQVHCEPRPHQEPAVFLASLFAAERAAAERLQIILQTPAPSRAPPPNQEQVARLAARQGLELAPRQEQAVVRALTSKVLVITGGPGTGKTTIVQTIILALENRGEQLLLAAPTGRAAKRMQEACGRPARTLHRWLEFRPNSGTFHRHRGNPLEADMIIIDEVSMVDLPLFHSFLEAVPDGCRLILVGDVEQLPSVGPGSVLEDVIASGAVETVTLREIFRQARESQIVVNAHRVLNGELPHSSRHVDAGGDFFFVERSSPEEVLETLKEFVVERIPRRFGMRPVEEIQTLTPMQRGLLGYGNLNRELQELLNPGQESWRRGDRELRVGDRVIQTRNNYDLEVFNGDVGCIQRIEAEESCIYVRYEARMVRYTAIDLDDLSLAYAISIHKSQGSEYPVVVVPLHTQHYVMLQRNLLYTAITRGKRLVVLIGSRRALAIAVRNRKSGQRLTRLAQRLK
ncbi:MAG: ATP-dependent RecD-like DNA helicase, partial [Planctomycetota bacterium]